MLKSELRKNRENGKLDEDLAQAKMRIIITRYELD